MRLRLFYISSFLLLFGISAAVAQQAPPPGTSIDNQAQITYIPSGADTVQVLSNTVSAKVQSVTQLQTTPDHQRESRVGQGENFTHRLINTGNTATTVTITAESADDNEFTLEDIILSAQTNAKGKGKDASPDQTSGVADSLTVSLNSGQEVTFGVSMHISDTAEPGQSGVVKIKIKTAEGTVIAENTNRIILLEGPVIEVAKQQMGENAEQGSRWTYSLTASNTGDQVARAVPVSIDGESQSKVLLIDEIPLNTTFASVEESAGGAPLYHTVGSAANEYRSTLPDDLSSVDKLAVVFDSLAAGQSKDVQFSVTINSNASGTVPNTASMAFSDPIDEIGQVSQTQSNGVQAQLPEYDPALHYYTNDSYSDVSRATVLGQPLLLQADAAQCNLNVSVPDTTILTLTSQKTDDEEGVSAVETGPNTGYFRIASNVSTRSAEEHEIAQDNGIIETLPNDIITATAPTCGEQSEVVTTQIMVSPFGVIFDSETGEPVAGAVVTLIDATGNGNDGNPGEPAQVFDGNGIEELANPQTTAVDGEFRFPYLKPSTYRIEITTPAGYIYASDVAPQDLPDGRTVNAEASYGEEFIIEDIPGPAAFDIPLDPDPNGVLFLEKNASVNGAAIGDFVSYQLTVTNNSAETITQIRVEDTLPFGFRYEKGTARLDGDGIDDPEGGKGPVLTFKVGEMDANESIDISYRVLLGAGVRSGEATNTAVAISDEAVAKESNLAQSIIDVRGGVFSDKGYIIGKVFADYNENDVQDHGEPGVPGVQLYLQNGTFVITDSEGKYTFYGINPNKHIVKIDNYSLPEGSRLSVLDNRHARDPSNRLVDLKKGQLHRADFAICDLTPRARKEVKARREQLQRANDEALGASVERNMDVNDNGSNRAVKREQASGIIGGPEVAYINKEKVANNDTTAAPDSTAATPQAVTPDSARLQMPTLEEIMIYEEPELGFIGLQSGDTLRNAQAKLWIKSKQGAKLVLAVNGEEVDDSRISKKAVLSEKKLQAFEYLGIQLQSGKNIITVTETDPFGNKRDTEQLVLFAPGKVATINLTTPQKEVPADGISATVVQVQLKDKSGIPVKSKVPVTLDVSAGQWIVQDADPNTPGTQTFVQYGQTTFKLKSPLKPQDADVRVSMGVMEEELTVSFLPDLRPLLAAGIIEGTIRLNGDASIVPARSADGFERELKSLSYTTGDITADARTAFFLKGKIRGNMLLTAGFDSEKDDDQLFRDIQPDEFYPVYGESSVKGYDAQSTSRLYVRVDHKRTYALYGDFATQERHPAKSLGEYNRTQTGLKLHYEKDWLQLNAFGSQATSLQRIDEFRGQGISGPYELQSDDILINSEQVELITRDRNRPTVVIEREQLSRFRDYVIEPFSGNIIFKSAVPSADRNLNPVFVRVTYEVEGGAEDYLVAGADGQFKIAEFFEVGGSFVEDHNPEDNYRLKSVNTTLRLSENTVLIGEGAEITTDLEGTGQAGRVELQHRGDNVDGRVFAGKTDQNFVNRSSRYGQGRTEAGGQGNVKLSKSTNLKGEFVYSRNDTLDSKTAGGVVNIEQRFTDDIRAEAGVRYARQEGSPFGSDTTQQDATHKNMRGKLTLGIPKVEGASIFGEYEQDVSEASRRLIALGGDYRIKQLGKVYGRHEFISSALGAYNLDSGTKRQNTVVGIDANYMKNGQVYSEYRVDDAFDGQNAQAAIGLHNRFQIREGFGINAAFERIFSVSGDPRNEGTAISSALDYTANPLWKGTARAEARFSNNGTQYLNTLGYGRKVNSNWTFLGKNVFTLQTTSREGTPDRIRQRMRLGMAYRQTEQNRWDGLGRYELKYEENGEFGGGFNRLVHIFSSNVNFHPGANWTHTGRLAAKKIAESSAQFDSESMTMLLSGRTMYDITQKLDGGINVSLMTDAGLGAKDYGAGVELGYIMQRNLRLALGFNATGFEDRDLVASNYTREGVYVGFSYKFDERLFRGLMPESDRNDWLYATCDGCADTAGGKKVLQMPEASLDSLRLPSEAITARVIDRALVEGAARLPKNIHFGTDESLLSETSKQMLDRVADYLKNKESTSIEITGHTDSRGAGSYNMQLSKQRAAAVKQYLISKGVIADLIDTKGMGENKLAVDPEEDMIDLAINRRIEFNLDIPNINVRFIHQYKDLHISKPRGTANMDWDYIFNTDIQSVPNRIHITADTLGHTTQYLLNRIRLALQYHPSENAVFSMAGPQAEGRKRLITSFLEEHGADMKRIRTQSIHGKAKDGLVKISYGKDSHLSPVTQRDDVRYANGKYIEAMLEKMLELLTSD